MSMLGLFVLAGLVFLPATPPALEPLPDITFLSYGDSKTNTAGWQATLVSTANPQAGLNKAVGTATGVNGILARNGSTVATMQDNVDADLAAATGHPVDIVLFNLGVNEARAGLPEEAAWKADALYIIDALDVKYPGVHVYTMRVWARDCAACPTVNQWIDDLSSLRTFVSAGPDESVWMEGGDDGATMTDDGVHPNAAGNAECAAQWKTVLGY